MTSTLVSKIRLQAGLARNPGVRRSRPCHHRRMDEREESAEEEGGTDDSSLRRLHEAEEGHEADEEVHCRILEEYGRW